jgi:nitrite reductase/ring-hydroxylating ferredoxin subunit
MAERKRLANLKELQAKEAIKFTFREEGISREGFLALVNGQIVCYENLCRHLPLTLDYGDGKFFTRDQKHIVCQNHGATYDSSSGLCVSGPCTGATLKRIPVLVIGDEIWIEQAE